MDDSIKKKRNNLDFGVSIMTVPKKQIIAKAGHDIGGNVRLMVFCEDCKHLRVSQATDNYACWAPSNLVAVPAQQHWLSPSQGFTTREHPRQKNVRNLCRDFEPKNKKEN